MIDCKITDPNCFESLTKEIRQDLAIKEWRSINIASGAFRENLIGLVPKIHTDKRLDWILWVKLYKELKSLREIGFSDYTIQYPFYKPVNNPNTSFSIRYAKEESWLIFKGQARNAKNNTGDLQYYAHAKMLISLGLFCGEDCCAGDQYILNLSRNPNQSRGNPQKWVKIGVNHHMCMTLRQLENMN